MVVPGTVLGGSKRAESIGKCDMNRVQFSLKKKKNNFLGVLLADLQDVKT